MTLLQNFSSLDPIRWGALIIGVLFLVAVRSPSALDAFGSFLRVDTHRIREKTFLWLLGFIAAALSLGYTAFYLKGGPRSIDATSYYLQARALSDGQLSWEVPNPSGSFRGRFLLVNAEGHMGGIFPPGYPLLLSLGFVLGAPLIVGPLIGGALAIVTYLLAKELAKSLELMDSTVESVARAAGLFSVFSAALRYHTADTMSHGAAALGISVALLSLLVATRERNSAFYVIAGLATGYVLATRPFSALGLIFMGALFARRGPLGVGAFLRFGIGVVPGLALLVMSQASVAGEWFRSTQSAYYSASDGPPGCFRMGFGADIGCLLEHGDFIAKYLPHGFGLREAVLVTLRRLWLHLGDVTNSEALTFVLVGSGIRLFRSSRALQLAVGLLAAHVLSYFPFYFDGNYPAAGGRLLADMLPIEHALGVIGIAHFFTQFSLSARVYSALSLSSLSFALYAYAPHNAFAASLGGRPMVEPVVLQSAAVIHGLVYVDTDHGFNLAFDPSAKDAKTDLIAVRRRGDDRDRLAYDLLGHPTSRKYVFDLTGKEPPRIEFYVPESPRGAWRFEAENEWPPLLQSHAWARPAPHPAASGGKWLVIESEPGTKEGRIEFDLPVLPSHTFSAKPQVGLLGKHGRASMTVVDEANKTALGSWQWSDDGPEGGLLLLDPRLIRTSGPRARVVLVFQGSPVALDAFFVEEDRAVP